MQLEGSRCKGALQNLGMRCLFPSWIMSLCTVAILSLYSPHVLQKCNYYRSMELSWKFLNVSSLREVPFLGTMESAKGDKMDSADTVASQAFAENHWTPQRNFTSCSVSSPTIAGTFKIFFFKIAKSLCDLLTVPLDYDKHHRQKWTQKKEAKGQGKGSGQIPSKWPVIWTEKCQQILNLLINCLIQPPITVHSNFVLPFILHVDASNKALGAVLYQHQEGKLSQIESKC